MWIKNQKGELINFATVTRIYFVSFTQGGEIRVDTAGGTYVIRNYENTEVGKTEYEKICSTLDQQESLTPIKWEWD